jgi:regulator of protease activity HflC (stomatin/prohibitin superfamily)
VINVPTRDGVLVGVEGTFYFQLNLDEQVLRAFDDKFGTRTFPTGDGTSKAAWDGDEGWSAFLNFTLGNLVQNVLRQEIGQVYCRDLVSSCALAQNTTTPVDLTNAPGGNSAIADIQDKVNKGFVRDLENTLGTSILTNVQFALSKVSLPQNIQDAINAAQAAFAATTAQQAAQQAAKVEAETNNIRQQGYANCPVCAQIDLIKALPPGLTTYAPGSGFAVTGGTGTATNPVR